MSEPTNELFAAALACTSNNAIPARPGDEDAYATLAKLLADGADPDPRGGDDMTPLHCAAWSGNVRLARMLVDARASLSAAMLDTEHGTPLAVACFYAQTDAARFLASVGPVPDNLRHAACIDADLSRFFAGDGLAEQAGVGRDFYRPSLGFPEWAPSGDPQEILDEALSWSARHGAVGAMATLLDRGADPNSNPYRGTPLLWAVYADQVEAATLLLDRGADPDLRHDFGGAEHGKQAVAMHLAAQYGSLRCLDLLLERGADATVKDGAFGGTPLGWAEFSEQEAAATQIREHLGGAG